MDYEKAFDSVQTQAGFAIRLRHSPWANFEVLLLLPIQVQGSVFRRIIKLIGETQKNPGYTDKSTGIPKYESTYTASAFGVYLYDFDVYIPLGNNDR